MLRTVCACRPRLATRLLVLALLAAATLGAATSARAGVDWRGNFETDNYSEWDGVQSGGAFNVDGTRTFKTAAQQAPIVSDVVRQDTHGLKIEVDPGDYAYDTAHEAATVNKTLSETDGSDFYYGMSFLFPSDWQGGGGGFDDLVEWMPTDWRNHPSYGTVILDAGDANKLKLIFHTGRTGDPGTAEAGQPQYNLVYTMLDGLPKGVWLDFVVHFEYRAKTNGAFTVWYRQQGQTQWTKQFDNTGAGDAVVNAPPSPTWEYNSYGSPTAIMEAGIYTKALSYPRILWLDNFSRGTTFADVASTWSSSSSTAAVTTTTAPAPTVSASPAPNPGLAPNPGFELDPAASYYSSGTAAFSWATDAAHSAAHSLKIASADSGLSRWGNQPALLPVTAGASYDIGAFFKLASVTSQARLGVSFYGANGFLSAAAGPEALSGTSDWRQTSMSVVVPAAATSMRVEFRLYGTGTLWADDVSVAPTTTPTVTAPVATSAPTISGKATQDELLSATTGAWSGSPTSYSYQWRRCDVLGGACTDLAGATAATYKLAAADVGLTLRVHVLATNSAGTTSADSAQTPVVTAPLTAPLSTSPPSISGSTMVGKTLTASAGNWSGSPSKYAYQWQRCNATGAACAAIANATAATYAPTSADAGTTLRVAVTATNPGGSTTATSSATRTIKGR